MNPITSQEGHETEMVSKCIEFLGVCARMEEIALTGAIEARGKGSR